MRKYKIMQEDPESLLLIVADAVSDMFRRKRFGIIDKTLFFFPSRRFMANTISGRALLNKMRLYAEGIANGYVIRRYADPNKEKLKELKEQFEYYEHE